MAPTLTECELSEQLRKSQEIYEPNKIQPTSDPLLLTASVLGKRRKQQRPQPQQKNAPWKKRMRRQYLKRSAGNGKHGATTIVAEPPTSEKNVVRVALKMPEESGIGRIVRRFPQDASLEDMYAFVECYSVLHQDDAAVDDRPEDYEHEYKFRIASILPREVYEPSTTVTMGEKIGRSGNLIVEYVSLDSEDESDDDVDDEDEETEAVQ
ncbi:hypothetical protein NXS19_005770 [Fusarium pseudograminearum]|nr:hypothetical protein NXS19_005770 [Fusarium pseudograminearum]